LSRQYRWHGDILSRRDSVKPRTPAWEASRERRRVARAGLAVQTRDGAGFIVKIHGDGIEMYDPGPIDRYLWLEMSRDTEV
jgi:hypothetical protein